MSERQATWEYLDPVIPGRRGPELYTRRAGEALEVFITQTSASAYDWLMNFNFGQVCLFDNNKQIKVHAGFLTWAYLVCPVIERELNRRVDGARVRQARLHGASAGGAVALIVGAMLIYARGNEYVESISAYGAPAAGNKHFARYLREAKAVVTRGYCPFDIVANAPYWLVGMRQAGAKRVRRLRKWHDIFSLINNHKKICTAARKELGI